MVHVGLKGGALVTINEVAECFGISKNHLTKVVHQLGKTGYLETVRGKYGGVRLMKRPEDIRLGALIRDAEEDFDLARCMRSREVASRGGSEDGADDCRLDGACMARSALDEALRAFFAVLDRYTLADMLCQDRSPEVVRLLAAGR